MLRPWFLVEQPSGSGGTSVLVYSSGPGQPDVSSVEQPAGAIGTSALVYSSGPGQPNASSVMQPTGDERHLGDRVLERYGAARRHQRGVARRGDRHLGTRVLERTEAARRLRHGAARRGGFEPWCSCARADRGSQAPLAWSSRPGRV
jgi:hypothetical protein